MKSFSDEYVSSVRKGIDVFRTGTYTESTEGTQRNTEKSVE